MIDPVKIAQFPISTSKIDPNKSAVFDIVSPISRRGAISLADIDPWTETGRIRDISNPSGRQLERRQSITEADVNLGPIIRCRGVSRILTCRRLDSLHAFTDGFEMSSPTRSSRIDSPLLSLSLFRLLIPIRRSFFSSIRLISYATFGERD